MQLVWIMSGISAKCTRRTPRATTPRCRPRQTRPRESMVGVDVVLAHCPRNTLRTAGFIWSMFEFDGLCQNHVHSNHVFTSPAAIGHQLSRGGSRQHVCIYICMYVCVYIYIYIYIYTHTYIRMYIYIYTQLYGISLSLSLYIYMYTHISYIHIHVYIYIYIYIHTFIHTYIHTYTYIYILVQIITYTYQLDYESLRLNLCKIPYGPRDSPSNQESD